MDASVVNEMNLVDASFLVVCFVAVVTISLAVILATTKGE